MRLIFLAFAAVSLLAETNTARIEKILASSPDAQTSFWGVRAVDLKTGRAIVEYNATKMFVPASNTKLFSTGLALSVLGPQYRHETTVRLVDGNLVIYGSGDPTISNRVLPYDKDIDGRFASPTIKAIETLADEIVAAGVKTVFGNVIGDDTAYVWEPYPEGWAVDDAIWEYGAPVSALTINDNAIQVRLAPGKAGETATLAIAPAVNYYIIHNYVTTVDKGERKIWIDREPGSREITIRGTLVAGSSAYSELLAIDDPALYAAQALLEALERRGVNIAGDADAKHRRAGEECVPAMGKVVAKRVSPPLVESLKVIDKVSQNLLAELMLREVGRVKTGDGSVKTGLEQMKIFLASAGVGEKAYVFHDGSGLSRLTLVSPDTVSKLLTHMYNGPYRQQWIDCLPIGGEDGTLNNRFEKSAAGKKIHAKTGSLSHVSALGGYAESATYGTVAFSILVNNFNQLTRDVRKVIDQIALTFIE